MCVCREGRATRPAVVDGVGLCSSFAPNKNGKMFGVLEELLVLFAMKYLIAIFCENVVQMELYR